MRECILVAALLGPLLLGARPAASQPLSRVGPSFPCPTPKDPLAQLICDSADLSRLDLAFVQTYQAYRQSLGAEGQKALRAEAAEFGRAVRASCGIANAQPNAPPAPPDAGPCVGKAYERQRAIWADRLSGAAAEEAQRPLEQHLALQGDLQNLGLLPMDQALDGVFGPTTRNAIIAFQQTMGLRITGLLGADDAVVLERQVAAHRTQASPGAQTPAPATPARGLWEVFQADALGIGLHASATVTAEACSVLLDVRQPEALGRAVRTYYRQDGDQPAGEDKEHSFKAALTFLATQVAAKAVRAFYADRPEVDRCVISAAAYTADIYGRDVRQALFSFEFDRAVYERVVWDRFDPANMPKIVLSFSYGDYAQGRLRAAGKSASEQRAEPPVAPTTPSNPPQSPAAAPQPALGPTQYARHGEASGSMRGNGSLERERRFILALSSATEAFESAANDMAKGASRGWRAKQICEILGGSEISDWIGTVETLSSTSEGKGVLVIRIAPHVTLGTTNNALSDSLAPMSTLITDTSPVLSMASRLKPRQLVVFSGRFARSDTDCVAERRLTLAGSMRDPEFLFQFSDIHPKE